MPEKRAKTTRSAIKPTGKPRSCSERGKSQNNGLVTGALFFSSPRLMLRTHFALRARYRVRLAWLINRLFCRLETDNKISNALGVKFEATNIEMNFLKLLRFS